MNIRLKKNALKNKNKAVRTYQAKKGFSLLETVIAMTLIGIMFAIATTTVLTVALTRQRETQVRAFALKSSDYYECFKITQNTDAFLDALTKYLDLTPVTQSESEQTDSKGTFNVYYNAQFEKIADPNAKYNVTVTVDYSVKYLSVKVVSADKTVYSITYGAEA